MLRSVRSRVQIRLYHQHFESRTLQQYLKDPIKLLVLPVKEKDVFVYYKHGDDLMNRQSRIIRSEKWIIDKSLKLWSKLENSSKSYNKKIVLYITKLLDTVPWSEDSLISVPNESSLLKRLKDDGDRITLKEYQQSSELTKSHLLPLHIYYPIDGPSIPTSQLIKSLRELSENGLAYHKKHMIYCALGLPLTIPLVLLPVVPNVPGFYLMYRLYCNFKAFLGARHLQKIVNEEASDIFFYSVPTVMSEGDNGLTEEKLPIVLDQLEVQEIENKLKKAIRQSHGSVKED